MTQVIYEELLIIQSKAQTKRQILKELTKLMTDKGSTGGSATTGNLKVLHREDMKNIYRMANR